VQNLEDRSRVKKGDRSRGLDDEADEIMFPVEMELTQCDEEVTALVEGSPLVHFNWPGRGVAPIGYLKGMGLTFARAYSKLLAGDQAAQGMALAATHDAQTDALAHYATQFAAVGMENSQNGADTLRHLFVLLIGLGMRESAGRYCEGRDLSNHNVTPEMAEAGLFQMSFSIGVGSSNPAFQPLVSLYNELKTIPYTGYRMVFAEDVDCSVDEVTGFGTTAGGRFRRFCILYPALCAEIAAFALRSRRKHWGPINQRTATLNTDCDELLATIQETVDAGNCQAHFFPR
jgi:hypothetical protein